MNEERRHQACHERLTLDPGSRKAFADRQAKLIQAEDWPLAGWYTDEDFCRAYNTATALKDDLDRLQAIVDKLPKTADGVPVVPGMEVWVTMTRLRQSHIVKDWTEVDEQDWEKYFYSTREAAEAAARGVGKDGE